MTPPVPPEPPEPPEPSTPEVVFSSSSVSANLGGVWYRTYDLMDVDGVTMEVNVRYYDEVDEEQHVARGVFVVADSGSPSVIGYGYRYYRSGVETAYYVVNGVEYNVGPAGAQIISRTFEVDVWHSDPTEQYTGYPVQLIGTTDTIEWSSE